MTAVRHPIDAVASASIEVSSVPRNWRHVRAWRHLASADALDVPGLVEHTLLFDVTPGVDCHQRFADVVKDTPYRPLDITIVPAFRPALFDNAAPAHGSHIDFGPAFLDAVAAASTEGRTGIVALRPVAGTQDAALSSVAGALLAEARSNELGNMLLVDALSLQLAIMLLRSYAEIPVQPIVLKGGLSPFQLRRVTDYMQDNLAQPHSLGEFAAVAGLSPYHFCRAFKASTGLAPHAWLRQRRIERACALIAGSPQASLIDVAMSLGYQTQSAFGTAFRQQMGKSPGRWRRDNCG